VGQRPFRDFLFVSSSAENHGRPLKIQNPKSKIQNPKSKIQNPKSKINNQQSTINNLPLFPWRPLRLGGSFLPHPKSTTCPS
jgi:hypothetical protein